MTAIDQLAAFYGDDPGRFTGDLHAHILHGYVYITPTALALARPVSSKWTREQLSDPWQTCLTCAPDCWYVWAAIGDLDFLLSLIPYELPLIAFARRKLNGHHRKAKFYELHEIYGRRSTRSTEALASGICEGAGDSRS